MNYETNYILVGRMREGTGTWGIIYEDSIQKLRKHRVSYLTRPQNEEHYGDKDVLHEQLIVYEEYDPASAPSDFHSEFDEISVRDWSGSPGEFHWWANGKFFVYAIKGMGETPSKQGGYYPSDCLRTVREAFEFVVEDKVLYMLYLSWDSTKETDPIVCSDGHIEYGAYWNRTFDRSYYKEDGRVWIHDQTTNSWNTSWLGWNNPVRAQIRVPIIPWDWRTWMWSMHPPVPVTDYEAYSECYRDAVSRVTQSGMNNFANVLEVASAIRDIKQGNIENLFKSIKDFADSPSWKTARRLGQDSWLKYRYVYGTTKADADAAVNYFLEEKWKSLTDRQVVRGSIGLSDGQLRLKMRLRESADLSLSIWNDLKSVGLYPDLLTLWDLVPYSFVVDWIVPSFSQELEDLSQKNLGAAYDVQELLVTRKQEWDFRFAGFTYYAKSYSRTFDSDPPQFEFYEEVERPKGKTVIKRIIDGFSLFIN